jgi:hypothetical protein
MNHVSAELLPSLPVGLHRGDRVVVVECEPAFPDAVAVAVEAVFLENGLDLTAPLTGEVLGGGRDREAAGENGDAKALVHGSEKDTSMVRNC